MIVLLEDYVGSHGLHRNVPKAAPGIRIEMFSHFLASHLDRVDRIAGLAFDDRQPVLGQILEVGRDERDDDVAQRHVVGDLQQQTFAVVTRSDTWWIELLDELQNLQCVFVGDLMAENLSDLGQRALQATVCV